METLKTFAAKVVALPCPATNYRATVKFFDPQWRQKRTEILTPREVLVPRLMRGDKVQLEFRRNGNITTFYIVAKR